jgi:hypothetical protein
MPDTVHDGRMTTIMNIDELTTIAQLADFLSGSQLAAFSVLGGKDDCYRWILSVLVKFCYTTLPRRDKPVVIRYLRKISGYSRQQVARLIRQYRKSGNIKRRQRAAKGFARKYTARISACSRRWTNAMTPSAALRSRSCASGPVGFLARRGTSAWL